MLALYALQEQREEWFKRTMTRTSRAAFSLSQKYNPLLKPGLICFSSETERDRRNVSQLANSKVNQIFSSVRSPRGCLWVQKQKRGPLRIHPIQTEQGGGGRGGERKRGRRGEDRQKETDRDRRGPGPHHIHAEILHMLSPPECFSPRPSL